MYYCNLDWNTANKSRHGVDIVYLDFAKAFNSVVHIKLCYGVCDMILHLIESWLCNRYQCVRVGGSLSSLCRVISGVPQGSVLFILFVNDIVCCVSENVSVKLFADDAKICTV